MPEYEVAHYHSMLAGALVWGIILGAAGLAFMLYRSRLRRADGPAAPPGPHFTWQGPVGIAAAVLIFFCAAPFVVYGVGPAPTSRGVTMVIANQAGYATSFLLIGLLVAGLARLFGIRGRATITFAIGTALGIALSVYAAAINGHAWLLAPP